MTTVVSNMECMAADQRVTCGGPMAHAVKIHRIRGNLYGVAGDMMIALHILNWLRKDAKHDPESLYKLIPPDHRDSADVLELSKNGLALWNGWGVRLPLMDKAYAIGSGAPYVLPLVLRGEPLDVAVKSVPILDECSGVLIAPKVETLHVPKPKRAVKSTARKPKKKPAKKSTGWRKAMGDE